jgi:WD40 repeat protein
MLVASKQEQQQDPLIAILRGHTSPITAICHHKAQDLMVSGDQDGNIHLWKDATQTRRSNQTFRVVKKEGTISKDYSTISKHLMVLQLFWLNESGFVCQSRNCMLSKFDLQQKDPVYSVAYSNEIVQTSFCKMAMNYNGTLLAAPVEEAVQLYSTKSMEPAAKVQVKDCQQQFGTKLGMLMSLCFHTTHEYDLFGAYENGYIFQWDLRKSNEPCICRKSTVEMDPVLCIRNFAARNDPSWDMIASSNTGKFLIFQPLGSQESCTRYEMATEGINDMLVVNNGKLLCTAGWDHRVRIYEIKKSPRAHLLDLKPLAIYKNHNSSVTCLDTNGAQNLLVSGSQDTRICLWSLQFHKKKRKKTDKKQRS